MDKYIDTFTYGFDMETQEQIELTYSKYDIEMIGDYSDGN